MLDDGKKAYNGLPVINKLIGSFDVLEVWPQQMNLVYCKSLLPASGFQTHQFRLIEIILEHLIRDDQRKNLPDLILAAHFEHIYWRSGAMQQNGDPAKILVNFNTKYDELFCRNLKLFRTIIYIQEVLAAPENFRNEVKADMMKLEESILMWKVAHLKAIVIHIKAGMPGTGGTNGMSFPIRNQKILLS